MDISFFYKISFFVFLIVFSYFYTYIQFIRKSLFDGWIISLIKIIFLYPIIFTFLFKFILTIFEIKYLYKISFFIINFINYFLNYFILHVFSGLSNTLIDLDNIWQRQFPQNIIIYYLHPKFKLFIFFVFLMGLCIFTKVFRLSFNKNNFLASGIKEANINIGIKKIYIQIFIFLIFSLLSFIPLLYANFQQCLDCLVKPKLEFSFTFFTMDGWIFYFELYLWLCLYAVIWLIPSFFIHLLISTLLTIHKGK